MNYFKLTSKTFIILFIGGLLAITSFSKVFAQNDRELLKGIKLVHTEQYIKALPVLESVLTKDSKNAEALYYAGVCNLQLSHNKKGLEYLEKGLAINPNIDKENQLYWLGVAYHYNYEFDKAIAKFTALKKNIPSDDPRKADIEKILKELQYAKEHQKVKPKYYVEILEGSINTTHSEHSPLLSTDDKNLYFTSRRDHLPNQKAAPDGQFMEDIFTSSLDNNLRWSDAKKLNSSVLDANKHEASVQLFEDDSKMLVYRHKKNGDIFVIKKNNDGSWGKPTPIDKGVINTKAYEAHAFITKDGKTIYFASDRDGGNLDIYRATKNENEKWENATKLGPEINTDHDEDAPFITQNGKTMYFSSTGHNSMGGYDVFSSELNEKTNRWGKAQHLLTPVNTPQDDIYLVMDKTGSFGYFSSNREGGKGEKDIYKIGKTYSAGLKGLIASETNKEPILGVKMTFFDEKYKTKVNCNNANAGNYTASLPCDATYKVAFFSDDYKLGKEPFHTDNVKIPVVKMNNKVIEKNFLLPASALAKLTQDYTFKGAITSAVDGSPMNGTITVIGDNNQKFETKTRDGNFSLPFKSKKGEKYKVNFITDDGTSYDDVAVFEAGSDIVLTEDLHLDKIAASTSRNIGGTGTVKTLFKVVYFDFNKSKITSAGAKTLDGVASFCFANQGISNISLTGHTDNVGSNGYNERLARKRAKSTMKYLARKGISKKAIKINSKGEIAPATTNDDESGRQQNRRVEIQVN